MSGPPFESIAVAGLGLIGGSIALGVRERWPSVRVTAVDRPAVLAHVAGTGAVDRTVSSVAELRDADLIVLAAPIQQNLHLLREVASGVRGVVTDVGGTKRDIVAAAAALPAGSPTFVGGHPIGGAEQGGFGFARADLFRGRPWIFTPGHSTPVAVMERLFALAEGLGARPTTLDPAEHDRLMSFVSHLPQLVGTALMDTVGEVAGADGLRLAGRGLIDTTRLASSPSGIWRDVCASNADVIGEALDALIARLGEIRGQLRDGDAIEATFERAARRRAELTRGRD
jgi:prephenate dehydrogenase